MAQIEEKSDRASLEKTSSPRDVESVSAEPERSLWTHLKGDVDPAESTAMMAAYSFMTGFIDAVSFTAIFVWCGFQTGNYVQLSLALARLFSGPAGQRDTTFHRADQQAITSLVTFNLGASIGRIGDRIGPLSRLWLISGTLLQALFTMAAAIAIWKSGQGSIAEVRGDPAWTNVLSFVCIAFMSASLGLQGIMAKRLNTPFGTTIVLTTIWCELVAEPLLFTRKWVPGRDHKLYGAACIFLGGFVGRALVDSIGAKGALGIGAGVRVIIAVSWLVVPGKGQKKAIKN